MKTNTKDLILKITDLDITLSTYSGSVHAIRGVNLELERGKTLALVGESGSGKSLSARTLLAILPLNATINSGKVIFAPKGEEQIDLLSLTEKQIRHEISGKKIAMVFQDPMTSLNPTMRIGVQLAETLIVHGTNRNLARDRALDLLKMVEIKDAKRCYMAYPHQLSGGMRQRVAIAMALSCNPQLLICDEPTTALDVTVQSRILELIKKLQDESDISVIYITHDLGVVAKVADYVDVMYAGKVVESGTVEEIFYEPAHPYTWGLLASIPDQENVKEELYSIPGTPPLIRSEIQGDAFAPRNEYALNIDFREEPPMFRITDTHYAASWLLDKRAPKLRSIKYE